MQEEDLIDWIRLINSSGIGPVTFYKLLAKFGSVSEALKYLPTDREVFSRRQAEEELDRAFRSGVRILARTDKEYPEKLSVLNDAPPLLYAKGQVRLLSYPAVVAVVGARNASVNGRKIASKIAYDLTQSEVLVASGLARGIDAAAHKGALYANDQTGATLAVLGTGVDVPYPTENTELYEQVCAQGLVVSEYPLGTVAQTNNFPRRNRIVSALSDGVLVVEASLNSGSLITARLGLEQGKDIFAVPGSPLEGRSAGANRLIREGAILTESAEDIINILKITQNRRIKDYISTDLFETHLDKSPKNEDSLEQNSTSVSVSTLLELIPVDGIDADDLIRRSRLSATQAMIQITELELDDQVERRGSRLFIKKHSGRNKV